MSVKRTDYFKMGLFILGGTAFFVIVIVVLGAGRFFKETMPMETYINESINGLEVGSALKYRGVKVGRVSEINFVLSVYTEAKGVDERLVYVACEMDLTKLPGEDDVDSVTKLFEKGIQEGLRVRPTSSGLTGQLFLELDFVNPKQNPYETPQWKPRHLFLPAAPSTLSRIEGAISSISDTLSSIDKADIEDTIKSVHQVMDSLSTFLAKADAKSIGELVQELLKNGNAILARVDTLLAAPEAAKLIPNASDTLAEMKRLLIATRPQLTKAADDLQVSMLNMKTVSEELEDFFAGADFQDNKKRISGFIKNADDAVKEARAAMSKMRAAVDRVNNLVASEQINIRSILENTRMVLENLKELTDEAKRNPSGVLFGEPPRRIEPGRNQ